MNDIIFLGGGGHAQSLIPLVLHEVQNINILGYVDIINHGNIHGVQYLGNDDMIHTKPTAKIINCIGSTEKSNLRHKIYLKYQDKIIGFQSNKANIYNRNTIHKSVQIMPGAIINPGVQIMPNVIINSGAIIEHNCKIGTSTHIAPGAVLCGNVIIGDQCHIGANVTILQNISIAPNTIIGANSLVTKNITESGTYYGVPVKLIKKYA